MAKYRFWILMGCTLAALAAAHILFVDANLNRIDKLALAIDSQVESLSNRGDDRASMALIEERRTQRQNALRVVDAVGEFFTGRDDRFVHAWFPETGTEDARRQPTREAFKRGVQLARDRLEREIASAMATVEGGDELGQSAFVPYSWLSGAELPPKGQLRWLQRGLNVESTIHRIMAAVGARVVTPLDGSFETAKAVSETMPFERRRFSFTAVTAPANLLRVIHAFDSPVQWKAEGGDVLSLALNVHVDAVAVNRTAIDSGNANRFDAEPPVQVEVVLTHLLNTGGGHR